MNDTTPTTADFSDPTHALVRSALRGIDVAKGQLPSVRLATRLDARAGDAIAAALAALVRAEERLGKLAGGAR